MEGPIVVVDDDIDVFETIEEAERSLEPQGVRRGQMSIFARDGRMLRPVIANRMLAEVVKIRDDGSTAADLNKLRDALIDFLKAREGDHEASYRAMEIRELFERALAYKSK